MRYNKIRRIHAIGTVMSIESNIFKRFIPDFNKLKDYGFKNENGNYFIEKTFKDNEFKAIVEIEKNGNITGKVYDLEDNDEYLPLRVEEQQGKFVGTVRTAYEKVLKDIRDRCFNENYFNSPQSNRIADYIEKKYNDIPEFLWTKFPGYGVFKNPDNNKWYGIIMNIDANKLEKKEKGEIEIINLKLDEAKVQDLLKVKGFYHAYHMNKKSWITVVLDETLNDTSIIELVDESHKYTSVKSKRKTSKIQ